MLGELLLGEVRGILVGHPPRVHAVHVDPGDLVVGRRRPRQHVQRGLRHVRVRVPGRLEAPVELPLDRRDVDDVLVALGRAQQQRLEARVEHERRDRVHELGLEQLDRRHLVEQQPPGVAPAQVDLLQILVEAPLGEQVLPRRRDPRAGAAPARALPSAQPPRSARHCRRRARERPTAACRSGAGPRRRRAVAARGRACPSPTPSRPPACAGRTRAAGARSGTRC